MSITIMREPLASFIKGLETFQFTVSSSGRIEANGCFPLSGLPNLDHDDAMKLCAEMNAAVKPILSKLASCKLEEFTAPAQLSGPSMIGAKP